MLFFPETNIVFLIDHFWRTHHIQPISAGVVLINVFWLQMVLITTNIRHVGVMRFSRGCSYIAPAAFPVHLMVSCLPANFSISSLPAFISPLCEWDTFKFLSGITQAVYGEGIVKSLRGQAICSKRKGVANRKKDIWRTTSFKAQVCIISKK